MLRSLLLGIALLQAASAPLAEYWSDPRGDYESRRREFVDYSANSTKSGLYLQSSRIALGRDVDEAPVRAAIKFINGRNDTSDFQALELIRIYQTAKPQQISDALRAEIRKTLLDFKYWPDEPGDNDLMCTWSENHQILFHSSEYLAGEMFADETFTNNGKTGRWHMERARTQVLRWINTKAKAGFSEWDSNSYFPEDVAALFNLADFARDTEVATQSAMLLDLMFFDMAVDSFRGTYGTSHGRSYSGSVLNGRGEGTTGVQRIAWGMGSMGSADNVASVFLATSQKYRVAKTIQLLAQDQPVEFTNRERQGLTIEAARGLGLRFEDPDEHWLMFDSGRLNNRALTEQSLKLISPFHLHRFDVVIRPYMEAVLGTYKELEQMGVDAEELDRSTLQQVDKITYRTPDYQLSAAQDYRKGKSGYQQHIWQATLSPDNIVFTLNPSVSSKYWVGRYPKAVQHKNLLIAIYNIPSKAPPGPKTIVPPDAGGNAMPSPAPSEELPVGFTVAVFRRAAYDEVVEKNGWVFGRRGQGFIALRSQAPVTWSKNGVLGGEGLIADGRRNVWICQMGRRVVDGPFQSWVEKIAGAKVSVDDLAVHYDAPGIGAADVSWDAPFTIDGKPVVTSGYDRFDNPYCRAKWGLGRYTIRYKGNSLLLDFIAGRRSETALRQ